VVAVWKFDRFARSVSHLLRALETFRTLGIEFVSLSESIDTNTPTGKMVFTVLASVAELERTLIGERVRAGLRNAKARGTRLGRPPLKDLSVAETQRLRRERRKSRTSFKELAGKYGVSVWTAFQLCGRTRVSTQDHRIMSSPVPSEAKEDKSVTSAKQGKVRQKLQPGSNRDSCEASRTDLRLYHPVRQETVRSDAFAGQNSSSPIRPISRHPR